MNLIEQYRERERTLEAAWAELHGPWSPRGSWPPHPQPPCFDGWAQEKYREEPVDVSRVALATTLYDAPEGRVLVCEKHWRQRRRNAGATEAEIRDQLTKWGAFTLEEADAMLAEDAAEGEARCSL